MSTSTYTYDQQTYSTRAVPQEKPKAGEPPQHQQHPQPQQSDGGNGPTPRAGTQLTVLTTNYSIAPGMVWFELSTPAAFTPVAGVPVKVAINPRGSGQLLRQGLVIPIAIAAIQQTPIPGTFFKTVDQTLPPASCTPLLDVQAEEVIKRLWIPGNLIAGCQPVGPETSGMSVQGFPTQPRQLMPTGPTAVLPSTMGINRAYLDTTVNPFELDIVFTGSGSVPAGTRFLVMTITGV